MFESLFHRLADDQKAKGPIESALQNVLSLAAPLYGVGAAVNRLSHQVGLSHRHVLPAVVFSIGNITMGGTGKTPFCLWLEKWLREQGRRSVVLTRGYGREDEQRLVVVHNGKKLCSDVNQAGDEPVLLAKSMKDVPVVACADRWRAGRYALRKFEVDTVILDDGFQHHTLARQADIVLVDATRPLSALKLFPRGTLREQPSVLSRAHLIVVTRWNQASSPRKVLADIRRFAPGVPVVRSRVDLTSVSRIFDGSAVYLESLKGKRALLICGVGNPKSVKDSLKAAGVKVCRSITLGDHEAISPVLLEKADVVRRRLKADYLVITEKDAVKLQAQKALPESLIAVRARLNLVSKQDKKLADRVLKARLHARIVRGFLK